MKVISIVFSAVWMKGKIVVLFNGFHKKTQKTPSKQIKQARKIMNEYFKEKKGH